MEYKIFRAGSLLHDIQYIQYRLGELYRLSSEIRQAELENLKKKKYIHKLIIKPVLNQYFLNFDLFYNYL